MPTQGLTYPGAPASVNGNKLTVERFVKTPSQVFRRLSDLTQEKFISDIVFTTGDANGGAVVYEQLTENDLYPSGDPREIAPGADWPMVNDTQGDPKVAHTVKRGSAMILTYEAVERDERDTLGRGLQKLANASIRTHNQLVTSAITAATTRTDSAATAWGSATGAQILADLYGARHSVETAGLGYTVDTVILHPSRALELLTNDDLRKYLPRENVAANPVLSNDLAGLAGLKNWIVTPQQPENRVDVLAAKIAGSMRDEKTFYSRVINDEERERYIIQAGRWSTAIITDPLSIAKITAVA